MKPAQNSVSVEQIKTSEMHGESVQMRGTLETEGKGMSPMNGSVSGVHQITENRAIVTT